MKINESLVQIILVSSKSRINDYMEQVKMYGTPIEICAIKQRIEKQKQLVESIKDRMYISFLESIHKAAEGEEDNTIITLFIFHPNIWSENGANCFMYIESDPNTSCVDINSRVKVYDGAYPTSMNIEGINVPKEQVVQYSCYTAPKQIERISSEVLSRAREVLKEETDNEIDKWSTTNS